MAGPGSLVLRPWIRELILGSDALSSPRVGQLLEVLQEAKAPGPSHAPDAPDVGAMLLVSDGTYSIRCFVTREALDTSACPQNSISRWTASACCPVSSPASGYLVATRTWKCRKNSMTTLRSTFQSPPPPMQVLVGGDPNSLWSDLSGLKPSSLLPYHPFSLSLSLSSGGLPPGLSLSQLLDEVKEDQEHQGALVHLAESCLMLAGPCTTPPLTRWAASRCRATGEAGYTVPSIMLHISKNDQQILSSLGRGPELPAPDPALQDISPTLISSPSSSPSSSGTPALPSHMPSEESGASISLLPALSLAAPDPVQRGSSQALPAICSAPGPLPLSSPHPSHSSNSSLPSCSPSLLPLGHVPNPHQAHMTSTHKPSLEFKELGLPTKNLQPSPRTRATKGAQESCPVWDTPKRHRDGSTFQYEYKPPCTSLCAQVQAARLPPQLVAWALHFLMEPQPESELTQV
ncbi:PREDICTED: adrenocortical dysplasia protein homolog isoform X2 [Galeopterus variegatus]|uniref:Adrenocortical dysplasia protein homolog isoform X2 n=1 Tax=Galeopterus variegatus TaxID=482537 RepID=A0ABM0QBQ5_GALVR|nr:PREDICTED: adrenocortical dysplasia protein homolog isoform X2 [Galeopterus variegatus]